MLIIYDKSTGKVISVNGVRPNGSKLSDAEKNVVLAEPLPDNKGYINIADETLMDKIFTVVDADVTLYVHYNENNNPEIVLPEPLPQPEPAPQPALEPTLAELQAQQLAQAEAIAAIFERLEGGI